jgi:hypothetical protein
MAVRHPTVISYDGSPPSIEEIQAAQIAAGLVGNMRAGIIRYTHPPTGVEVEYNLVSNIARTTFGSTDYVLAQIQDPFVKRVLRHGSNQQSNPSTSFYPASPALKEGAVVNYYGGTALDFGTLLSTTPMPLPNATHDVGMRLPCSVKIPPLFSWTEAQIGSAQLTLSAYNSAHPDSPPLTMDAYLYNLFGPPTEPVVQRQYHITSQANYDIVDVISLVGVSPTSLVTYRHHSESLHQPTAPWIPQADIPPVWTPPGPPYYGVPTYWYPPGAMYPPLCAIATKPPDTFTSVQLRAIVAIQHIYTRWDKVLGVLFLAYDPPERRNTRSRFGRPRIEYLRANVTPLSTKALADIATTITVNGTEYDNLSYSMRNIGIPAGKVLWDVWVDDLLGDIPHWSLHLFPHVNGLNVGSPAPPGSVNVYSGGHPRTGLPPGREIEYDSYGITSIGITLFDILGDGPFNYPATALALPDITIYGTAWYKVNWKARTIDFQRYQPLKDAAGSVVASKVVPMPAGTTATSGFPNAIITYKGKRWPDIRAAIKARDKDMTSGTFAYASPILYALMQALGVLK